MFPITRTNLLDLAAAAVKAQSSADAAFDRLARGRVASASGAARQAAALECAMGDWDRAYSSAHPDVYPVPAPDAYLADQLADVAADLAVNP
jgi:hypothetical protein